MGKDMADVNVTSDNSNNQVVFRNPAKHPLPPSAGAAVTVVTSGSRNVVHGQVNAGTSTPGPVFDNPA
jgi:hypothetical protein